ncbi:FGGY-family carbohydrate kinase [Fervidobacterium gondwanense]|uniref:Sugar (Pentulose or hexulose) kinase n=1 Tax=Fervidobacterium gondwanense DSM 13020 TaxID=1121883 RepID=A0A1M7SJP8_FERGO|nr:FGGY-family carbohydrate kinase [Fervidobacterium gondwanense]SHN58664.1 Sugar (pentulose or hexulose) kinase [Fervidobacterium gondwanense DSM 13020]
MSVLAIDCGTQSLRAIVFSEHGEILAGEKIEFEPYYSLSAGWAEQSPEFYWETLAKAVQKLKEKSPSVFKDIQALSLTTQRSTVIVVDEHGNPLRDAFVWLDEREAEGKPKLYLHEVFAFWLIKKLPTAYMAYRRSKANYMKQKEIETWKKVHKYLFLSGYLTYKLTGDFVDSTASQVGYVPFDYTNKEWIKSPYHYKWRLFGVEKEKLPRLVEPTQILGYVTKQASEFTGLKEGLPVIASGADKQCETLGIGCFSQNVGSISLGTTATIQTTTSKYIEVIPFIPPYPSIVPEKYNPEISVFRGYWLVSWFKKEFAHSEVREAEELNTFSEQILDKYLQKIPAGSDGLIIYPAWASGPEKPFSRGAVIGFSDKHTRMHLYRAIIEGINYALLEGKEAIERKTGTKIERIGLSGGGSKSREVCQITANMMGVPVYKVQTNETSALGAAISAYVGMGVYNDFEIAVKNMVRISEEFLPDMDEHEVYRNYYDRVYKKIWGKINKLSFVLNHLRKSKER